MGTGELQWLGKQQRLTLAMTLGATAMQVFQKAVSPGSSRENLRKHNETTGIFFLS